MKAKITLLVLLLAFHVGFSQGFVNLDFEDSTIATNLIYGEHFYTATLIGWTPLTVPFNSINLDAPGVNLEGTNNSYGPSAIQGNYSVYLQGGTPIVFPNTNGSGIYQTAQVPINAQSIIYWGDALRVSFNGQNLSFNAIGSGVGFTIWQADVSPYAGMVGQLMFNVPWRYTAILDNIQFSSSPVPEPGVLGLFALGGAMLAFRRWK